MSDWGCGTVHDNPTRNRTRPGRERVPKTAERERDGTVGEDSPPSALLHAKHMVAAAQGRASTNFHPPTSLFLIYTHGAPSAETSKIPNAGAFKVVCFRFPGYQL